MKEFVTLTKLKNIITIKGNGISDSLNGLTNLLQQIEDGASLADLHHEYRKIADKLSEIGQKERNIQLLARVRNVETIFKKPIIDSDKIEQIKWEASRIKTDLKRIVEVNAQATTKASATTAAGFNATEKPATAGTTEGVKPTASPTTSPSDLPSASKMATSEVQAPVETTAPEITTEEELAERTHSIENLNRLVSEEVERTTTENQLVFEKNKALHAKFAEVTKAYDEHKEKLRALQNKAAHTQVEYNKVLLELQFLVSEKTKTTAQIEAEYELLSNMSKRYDLLRRNYNFTKGETGVSEDLLEYLETMLGTLRNQKKVLMEKTQTSENSLMTLLDELNATIKKGKTLYYVNLT